MLIIKLQFSIAETSVLLQNTISICKHDTHQRISTLIFCITQIFLLFPYLPYTPAFRVQPSLTLFPCTSVNLNRSRTPQRNSHRTYATASHREHRENCVHNLSVLTEYRVRGEVQRKPKPNRLAWLSHSRHGNTDRTGICIYARDFQFIYNIEYLMIAYSGAYANMPGSTHANEAHLLSIIFHRD